MKTVDDIKLYPHNQETYDKIQEMWKVQNRVATIQATGTGKSYLILKCLYNKVNENKLVLAPSNYILEQLQNEVGEELPNTILITYSRLSFMNDEELISFKPSIIVLDEFHRCGAETWGGGVQKLMDMFPNAKILGTTATPVRFLDNERDMAEELFNSNLVTNLSLADAIAKKILPMPKYISALYTIDEEINNLKEKVQNSKNSEESKIELFMEIEKLKNHLEKSKGVSNILKTHLEGKNNGKFIVFCKNIQHLNDMKNIVIKWFEDAKLTNQIETYTAYTGYVDIEKEVQEFINNQTENTVKLLFSIDMFNEWVHMKGVNGVIMLRPTVSPIIYYQQIGRAIQIGKEENPLIFDFVNNFDNIGAKNFIADLKEFIEIEKHKNNNNNEDDNIDFLDFLIIDEVQNVKNLFDRIEDALIEKWDIMYDKLKEHKRKYGNFSVSRTGEDKALGKWIDKQKYLFKINSLPRERLEKLDRLGLNWSIPINVDGWDVRYNELIEYKHEFGNCNVSARYKKNKTLGMWVMYQRQKYKKGTLSNEKIQKLNELGFLWSESNRTEQKSWYDSYNELVKYNNEFGNCNVRRRYEKNKQLGEWVSEQRKSYKKGKLSEEKINMLESIGFVWVIGRNNSEIK